MAKTTNILDLNNRLEKVEKKNVAQNSYTSLKNKPKINNVTLTGNKSLADIGAAAASDLTTLAAFILGDGSGIHNALYRGKNLGTSFTAAQSAAIRDGSFKDLYIGDYWIINSTVYRIADFDYFLKSGDTECTSHHAVIVPDVNMDTQKMNDTNVTTGAYAGSKMYTSNMATAKAKIKADFGSAHILAHREYLANAVTNGKQSAGAWYDSEIELMTESMVYGAPHFAPACDGSTVPANYTVAYKQLNLFRHRPDLISNRQTYWLRDVVSAALFADVYVCGYCNYNNASDECGVRPYFCIY